MQQKIRVMTYNLHSGIGTDGCPNWERIAEVIRTEKPDLIGFEETAVNHARTPDWHLTDLLARSLQDAI